MNGKAFIPLIAGLGIGGFALWMGFNTLKNARGATKPVDELQLWCAKADIPRGTEITAEMIKTVAFPAALAPAGVLREKEKVVGRVPRVDAPAGLPILNEMLLAPGSHAGIYVKPGYRAVAVKIDEASGVDYHLEPGCFVDVVGSFSVRRNSRQETLARTIVENVEVGAVGARVSAVTTEEEDGKKSNRAVRAVTLFVRPDDVPKLLLAEQKGRIKLSLRNDDDSMGVARNETVSDLELTGEIEPSSSDSKDGKRSLLSRIRGLFGAEEEPAPEAEPVVAAAPPPVVPSEPPWEVAVIRGQARETVRFKSRDSNERVSDHAAQQQMPPPAAWPGDMEPPPFGSQEPAFGQPEPAEPQSDDTERTTSPESKEVQG